MGIHVCRGAEQGAAIWYCKKLEKILILQLKIRMGIFHNTITMEKIADLPNSFIKILGYPLLSLSDRLQFLKMIRIALKTKPDTLRDKTISQWLQENSIKSIDLINHIKAF